MSIFLAHNAQGKKKGSKKGKGKKGKGKKGSGKGKVDPAVSKAVAEADAAAVHERKECVEGVRWVNGLRDWFEKNRAPMFDMLRKLDGDGKGVISTTVFATGLRQIHAPLNSDDIEALTEALDFEASDPSAPRYS